MSVVVVWDLGRATRSDALHRWVTTTSAGESAAVEAAAAGAGPTAAQGAGHDAAGRRAQGRVTLCVASRPRRPSLDLERLAPREDVERHLIVCQRRPDWVPERGGAGEHRSTHRGTRGSPAPRQERWCESRPPAPRVHPAQSPVFLEEEVPAEGQSVHEDDCCRDQLGLPAGRHRADAASPPVPRATVSLHRLLRPAVLVPARPRPRRPSPPTLLQRAASKLKSRFRAHRVTAAAARPPHRPSVPNTCSARVPAFLRRAVRPHARAAK